MLATHAPFAEVLAIVSEEVIAIFPEPQSCSAHHRRRVMPARFLQANPDRVALAELHQRDLFHRTATQPAGESSVLHDPPLSRIDAVVRIPEPRRHHVRAKGRLTLGGQRSLRGPAAAMRPRASPEAFKRMWHAPSSVGSTDRHADLGSRYSYGDRGQEATAANLEGHSRLLLSWCDKSLWGCIPPDAMSQIDSTMVVVQGRR
jgi:hypothetical protein